MYRMRWGGCSILAQGTVRGGVHPVACDINSCNEGSTWNIKEQWTPSIPCLMIYAELLWTSEFLITVNTCPKQLPKAPRSAFLTKPQVE